MPRARVEAAKLAEVDLRVLKRLYEAEPDFTNLSAAEIIDVPIEFIGITDVKIRLAHLKSLGEIEGIFTGYGLAMARLSRLMLQRLEDPAPLLVAHEGENWIERIRWLLSVAQAPSDLMRDRDAVLARTKSFRRALPNAAQMRDVVMDDAPEIEVVVTDEVDSEASRRRQFPDLYENSLEDDFAELRLRALMLWLHDSDHPEFADVPQTRVGVAVHTDQVSAAAMDEVADLVGEGNGAPALTATAYDYLHQSIGNRGPDAPPRVTRGEIYRRALVEAERGELVQGRFTQFWEDMKANARG